jgi:hypothetical protein
MNLDSHIPRYALTRSLPEFPIPQKLDPVLPNPQHRREELESPYSLLPPRTFQHPRAKVVAARVDLAYVLVQHSLLHGTVRRLIGRKRYPARCAVGYRTSPGPAADPNCPYQIKLAACFASMASSLVDKETVAATAAARLNFHKQSANEQLNVHSRAVITRATTTPFNPHAVVYRFAALYWAAAWAQNANTSLIMKRPPTPPVHIDSLAAYNNLLANWDETSQGLFIHLTGHSSQIGNHLLVMSVVATDDPQISLVSKSGLPSALTVWPSLYSPSVYYSGSPMNEILMFSDLTKHQVWRTATLWARQHNCLPLFYDYINTIPVLCWAARSTHSPIFQTKRYSIHMPIPNLYSTVTIPLAASANEYAPPESELDEPNFERAMLDAAHAETAIALALRTLVYTAQIHITNYTDRYNRELTHIFNEFTPSASYCPIMFGIIPILQQLGYAGRLGQLLISLSPDFPRPTAVRDWISRANDVYQWEELAPVSPALPRCCHLTANTSPLYTTGPATLGRIYRAEILRDARGIEEALHALSGYPSVRRFMRIEDCETGSATLYPYTPVLSYRHVESDWQYSAPFERDGVRGELVFSINASRDAMILAHPPPADTLPRYYIEETAEMIPGASMGIGTDPDPYYAYPLDDFSPQEDLLDPRTSPPPHPKPRFHLPQQQDLPEDMPLTDEELRQQLLDEDLAQQQMRNDALADDDEVSLADDIRSDQPGLPETDPPATMYYTNALAKAVDDLYKRFDSRDPPIRHPPFVTSLRSLHPTDVLIPTSVIREDEDYKASMRAIHKHLTQFDFVDALRNVPIDDRATYMGSLKNIARIGHLYAHSLDAARDWSYMTERFKSVQRALHMDPRITAAEFKADAEKQFPATYVGMGRDNAERAKASARQAYDYFSRHGAKTVNAALAYGICPAAWAKAIGEQDIPLEEAVKVVPSIRSAHNESEAKSQASFIVTIQNLYLAKEIDAEAVEATLGYRPLWLKTDALAQDENAKRQQDQHQDNEDPQLPGSTDGTHKSSNPPPQQPSPDELRATRLAAEMLALALPPRGTSGTLPQQTQPDIDTYLRHIAECSTKFSNAFDILTADQSSDDPVIIAGRAERLIAVRDAYAAARTTIPLTVRELRRQGVVPEEYLTLLPEDPDPHPTPFKFPDPVAHLAAPAYARLCYAIARHRVPPEMQAATLQTIVEAIPAELPAAPGSGPKLPDPASHRSQLSQHSDTTYVPPASHHQELQDRSTLQYGVVTENANVIPLAELLASAVRLAQTNKQIHESFQRSTQLLQDASDQMDFPPLNPTPPRRSSVVSMPDMPRLNASATPPSTYSTALQSQISRATTHTPHQTAGTAQHPSGGPSTQQPTGPTTSLPRAQPSSMQFPKAIVQTKAIRTYNGMMADLRPPFEPLVEVRTGSGRDYILASAKSKFEAQRAGTNLSKSKDALSRLPQTLPRDPVQANLAIRGLQAICPNVKIVDRPPIVLPRATVAPAGKPQGPTIAYSEYKRQRDAADAARRQSRGVVSKNPFQVLTTLQDSPPKTSDPNATTQTPSRRTPTGPGSTLSGQQPLTYQQTPQKKVRTTSNQPVKPLVFADASSRE